MITGLLLLIPLLFSLAVIFINDIKIIRVIALTGSLSEWILSFAGLYIYFTQCQCLLLLNVPLIDSPGISLRFGMDGISLLMVLLTTSLVPLIILNARDHDYKRPAYFYGLMLFMETAFIGVFTAFNGIVYYIFWELALIPAYFICSGWGVTDLIMNRSRFFILTFTGSLFMLAILAYLYWQAPHPHSFDLEYLCSAHLTGSERIWVFMGIFLAVAFKTPIVPVFSRRPAILSSSSTAGSVLLTGIVVNVGIYGLIRFLLSVFL